MNVKELESLDEALNYLNEGRIIDTIKSLFAKHKKKQLDEKKQKEKDKNSRKYISLDKPIVSEARKKFRDKIASECKSIIAEDFAVYDQNIDDDYKDFYTIDGYFEGDKPKFNIFGGNEIIIISSDWYDLDAYTKYPLEMTKSEYAETPEVQKWYDDQEKVLEKAKKKFSKYGTVDGDGSYDDFYIYIALNKETIASFKDNEVIEKAINTKELKS